MIFIELKYYSSFVWLQTRFWNIFTPQIYALCFSKTPFRVKCFQTILIFHQIFLSQPPCFQKVRKLHVLQANPNRQGIKSSRIQFLSLSSMNTCAFSSTFSIIHPRPPLKIFRVPREENVAPLLL